MTTDQTLNRVEQSLEILTVHVGRLTESLTEFRADMTEIKDLIRQQFVANRELAETVRQQGGQIARQGEQQEQASILFREDLAEIKAMIRENVDITRQQVDVVSRSTGIVEQLIQNR